MNFFLPGDVSFDASAGWVSSVAGINSKLVAF
jgi:hypothetical protein